MREIPSINDDEVPLQSTTVPKNRLRIFIFLCIAIFLDFSALGLVLPNLSTFTIHKLGANGLWTGFLASSYALGQLVGSVVFGKLSDMFGRKKIMIIVFIGTSAGYAMLAFSYVLWYVALARFVCGLFGVTLTLISASIADITTKEERMKFIGALGAAMGAALILGNLSGGLLARYGFFVVCMVCTGFDVLNVFITLLFLKEPERHETEKKEKLSFTKIVTIMVSRKSLMILFCVYFLYFFSFATLQSSYLVFIVGKFNMSPLLQGINGAIFGGMLIIMQGLLAQWVKRRLGEKKMAIIFCITLGVFLSTCFLAPRIEMILIFTALISGSIGFSAPALNTLVTLAADEKLQGITIGIGHAFSSAGGAIAPIGLGMLYDYSPPISFATSGGALILAAFLLCFLSPERPIYTLVEVKDEEEEF